MKYANKGIKSKQLEILASFLPHNKQGRHAVFASKEDIKKALVRVRYEALQVSGGMLRSMNCLIFKLEQMVEAPAKYEGAVGKPTTKKRRVRGEEFAISTTFAQTDYLRDHLNISDVRWASDVASKTEMLVDRDKQAVVVDQLRQLYQAEEVRPRKRILSTVINKLGGEIVTKSIPGVSFPKRSCLKYVGDVCGVTIDYKSETLEGMVDLKDIPVLVIELRKMGSMVRGTARLTHMLIESLQKLGTAKPHIEDMSLKAAQTDLYEPSAADLEDIADFAEEIEQDEISDDEMQELSRLFFANDPLAAGMNAKVEVDYSELDGKEPMLPGDRYESFMTQSAKPAKEDDWQEDLQDYDDDEDYDEDEIIISDMTVTVDYFGMEELEMYGALDWEGTQIIFKEEDDRDVFCEAMSELVDAEIAAGKLEGRDQEAVERELLTLSKAQLL